MRIAQTRASPPQGGAFRTARTGACLSEVKWRSNYEPRHSLPSQRVTAQRWQRRSAQAKRRVAPTGRLRMNINERFGDPLTCEALCQQW